MDKELDELIEDGRDCIQQLLSIIEEHIHWDEAISLAKQPQSMKHEDAMSLA